MDVKAKLRLMEEIKAANEAHVKEWKDTMKNNNLVGVLIRPEDMAIETVEIPNTLEGLTGALDCEYIETAIRTIRGKRFMIVCDEEGRLKERQCISGVWMEYNRIKDYFVGNILVISADVTPDGDMIGLTPEEVDYVLNRGIIGLNGARILSYGP